ncbi:NLI interacting factor-like phosphatase-domain-containing protein [Morchella snyderi]|nr:NLI interacting factor-like phosphatase-domain-containing protein [Morchella snyderi]
MNSLSLLSSQVDKVIGGTPSSSTRPGSTLRREHNSNSLVSSGERSYLARRVVDEAVFYENDEEEEDDDDDDEEDDEDDDEDDRDTEQTALLYNKSSQTRNDRIYMALISLGAFRWFISTLVASTDWLISCVYDEQGSFSPFMPFRRLTGLGMKPSDHANPNFKPSIKSQNWLTAKDVSNEKRDQDHYPNDLIVISNTPTHHSRSKSISQDSNPRLQEEIVPQRSIRIRLYNEDLTSKSRTSSVKSPTSPAPSLRLTKYPRNYGPPMPLLPSHPAPKTLILDLDETLIHSLAKGGRMTSGHMVEVKLDRQHAILYYVHKRPYCDDFLRKVCKWYNLVVFTASVQEYADPVIDWLEQDRKYFQGRYYRQHCTQRNGAYIKDLSAVEPDLSKVMIIDNSPTSYCFHEDNAIPIEGWINDPTDIDLLHLIPLLEALQYATDVRALLALRMGETC